MTEFSTPVSNAVYNDARMQRVAVDPEHLGIRVTVPLMAFGGFVLVVWLGPVLLALLNLDSSVLRGLVIPLAVVAAIGAAFVGERVIKGRWSSGREILFDDDYLVLRDRKASERVISWGNRVNMMAWRFVVARRGRIPKGYYCLALQLVQDEDVITVYAFCDPKVVDDIEESGSFTPLASRKVLNDERLNMRAAGQQRRLLQAEDERWRTGAELTLDDFVTLWAHVRDQRVVQVS